jgi:hypothetical protein
MPVWYNINKEGDRTSSRVKGINMLRIIGLLIFTFVTYKLLHNSGVYPDGLGWAILYGLCVPSFLGMFAPSK